MSISISDASPNGGYVPTIFSTPEEEIAYLKRENEQLKRKNEEQQAIIADSVPREQYEKVVDENDVIQRVVSNPNMPCADKQMYIALINTYPALLRGESSTISVSKIRERAGWLSKDAATTFFHSMSTIDALIYDPGQYDKETKSREGHVTPNPDIFPFPENFSTQNTAQRKKAREDKKKKDQAMREAYAILRCQQCGSENIEIGFISRCKDCNHVHAPSEYIDPARITIEPEESPPTDESELAEEWSELIELSDEDILPTLTPVNSNSQVDHHEPASWPAKHEQVPNPAVPTFGKMSEHIKTTGTIPHCKHRDCVLGPNRTQRRLNGYFCTAHNGWIDEKGKPL